MSSFFSRLPRTALLTTAAALSIKALIITANGDWDDVVYAAKKKLRPSHAKKPRIVVLGTGWGALSFIQKLDQDAVELTVVSPRSFFFYTPLLAGTATGTISHNSIMEPVRWSLTPGAASFVQAECTAIDPVAKRITVQSPHAAPQSLEYDFLVCAVGAVPATFNIPGVREHARFLKEVEDGILLQRDILTNLERASTLLAAAPPGASAAAAEADAEVARLLSWVVIGGGPTGVELSGELADFLRAEVARYFPALAPRVRITLVEAADRVLGVFEAPLAAAAATTLASLGVRVECNTAVTRVAPGAVEFRRTKTAETGALPAGVCVWAGGVARRPVVEAFAKSVDPSGALQTSRHGLLIDGFFRVRGVADGSVFALGDCAVSGAAPTAQAAAQQGRFLGRAFRDHLAALAGAADPAAAGVPPFVLVARRARLHGRRTGRRGAQVAPLGPAPAARRRRRRRRRRRHDARRRGARLRHLALPLLLVHHVLLQSSRRRRRLVARRALRPRNQHSARERRCASAGARTAVVVFRGSGTRPL
jgi:NADH dehydrogenase FAD-containing subunit